MPSNKKMNYIRNEYIPLRGQTRLKEDYIINPILDEADLIEESYVLNVCSKGVDE